MDELFGWFMVALILAIIIAFFLAAIAWAGVFAIIIGAIALPIVIISKGARWYSKKPEAMSFLEYLRDSAENWVVTGTILSIGALALTFPAVSLFVHGNIQLDQVVWEKVFFPGLPTFYLLTLPVYPYFVFKDGKRRSLWEIVGLIGITAAIWGFSWIIASFLWGVGVPVFFELIEIHRYLTSDCFTYPCP